MGAPRRLDLVLYAAAGGALVAMAWSLAARGPAGLSGWPLAVHVAAKWLLLGAAVRFSLGNAAALGAAIGRGWLLFGLGIGALLAGELGEAFYQFVLGILDPFPSVLDVFYVAAYPLLIAALVGFLRAYAAAGYPMGSPRGSALLGAALVVVGMALLWPLVGPVVVGQGPLLERALAAAYPLLDVALLAAAVLLLRGTARFGGGRAWHVWALLLAGLAVMIAADLKFAQFTAGAEHLVDPTSEVLFLVSYLLLARGALKQRELIEA